MAHGNVVSIVGNITRSPELRFTKSGIAVAAFGVAYNNRRFNKATNDYEEDTSFFDVTVWQELAENVAASLDKGDRVLVIGRLEQQTWETAEGDKRSKVEIVADEVAPSLRWATVSVTKNERKGTSPTPPSATVPSEDTEDEPF